jgi:hypothetical protein
MKDADLVPAEASEVSGHSGHFKKLEVDDDSHILQSHAEDVRSDR